MREKKLIIGIDGGGTKTLAILFDNTGMSIDELECQGSNLYVYGEEGVKRIITLIKGLLEKNKLSFDDVNSYGIGVAGISDLNQRELLFRDTLKNDLRTYNQELDVKLEGIFDSMGIELEKDW